MPSPQSDKIPIRIQSKSARRTCAVHRGFPRDGCSGISIAGLRRDGFGRPHKNYFQLTKLTIVFHTVISDIYNTLDRYIAFVYDDTSPTNGQLTLKSVINH